jgi:hypothetical protein
VSTDDDRFRSMAQQPTQDRSSPRSGLSQRKRLISQKILISDEKDVVAAEAGEAELFTELLAPAQQHSPSVDAQSPSNANDDRASSQAARPSSSVAKKNYIARV